MDRWRSKKAVTVIVAAVAALAIGGGWMIMQRSNEEAPEVAADYAGHGGTFKNTLAEIDTPDPSVVYKDGFYYMTFTHNGADVMVMKSRTLDFRGAERKVVWYPPVDTMYSANLWAPEIQFLRGKWYIYFAADNGLNDNHRMYALEADTDDPMGSWTFRGPIADETNKWAIDGLALELNDKLYFVWSGWEGDVNIAQNTYIAPMRDPLTIQGPRVLLSKPELDWERAGGPPYINEGQAILKKNGRTFLFYSGAGSWTPFYSIGMLTLAAGADPLVPENWKKSQAPLLTMNDEAGVYGPGHNSFTTSPDGTEDWIVYHATSGISDGWNNRKARAQKVEWSADGMPSFEPAPSLDTAIAAPSGAGVFRAEHAVLEGGALTFEGIASSVETTAALLVHYTNESGAAVPAALSANGDDAGEATLPPTAAGETGYAYARVPLKEGANAIAIRAGGDGWRVTAIELPRYEAENAQAEGGALAETNPFATGWGVAKLPAGEEAAAIRFANVRVPVSGTYVVTAYVSNGSDAPARFRIRANGGDAAEVEAAPGERSRFAPVEARVKLAAGANDIVLDGASGPLTFDAIETTSRQ
ncbi:family 43 glycosylhydrolase [Paenibacillus sp.]|uniref:family 43 glycosylhydrolase n=1 Tax=Paenibacillus sp. TaxID=58172 RepID=UPI002812207A|nr:family 43 glycosylhydrolase [Paenibacillus sp.]